MCVRRAQRVRRVRALRSRCVEDHFLLLLEEVLEDEFEAALLPAVGVLMMFAPALLFALMLLVPVDWSEEEVGSEWAC